MDDNSVSNVLKSSIKDKSNKMSEKLDQMNGSSEDTNDVNNNESYAELRSNIKTISRLDPKEDLPKFFEFLDKKFFKGVLSENGVKAIWSNRLTKNFASINTTKDSNVIEIHLSRKLLDLSPLLEVMGSLLAPMNKVFKQIQKIPDNESDSKTNFDVNNDSVSELNKALDDLDLNQEVNEDEKKVKQKYVSYFEPKILEIELVSIVDERLERLDPKPDLQLLFKEYDKRYFYGILGRCDVEVVWSDRMTRNSGITSDATQTRPIEIRLSRQLLKFGSRRQLVETLLHEMIHALHFILGTDDGHGLEFLKKMNDLNRQTKANITVYHELELDRDEYQRRFEEHSRMRENEANQLVKTYGKNVSNN